jgi:hypothetical protein
MRSKIIDLFAVGEALLEKKVAGRLWKLRIFHHAKIINLRKNPLKKSFKILYNSYN